MTTTGHAATDTDLDWDLDDPAATGPATTGPATAAPATVIPADPPAPDTDDPDPAPKKPGPARRLLNHLRAAAATSAMLTRQPISLAEAWRRSGTVNLQRVPDKSDILAMIWTGSNHCDRIVWFGLYLLTPNVLAGAVLYVAERPTRRWGASLVLLLVLAVVPAMLARN